MGTPIFALHEIVTMIIMGLIDPFGPKTDGIGPPIKKWEVKAYDSVHEALVLVHQHHDTPDCEMFCDDLWELLDFFDEVAMEGDWRLERYVRLSMKGFVDRLTTTMEGVDEDGFVRPDLDDLEDKDEDGYDTFYWWYAPVA